jgi:hypothetical protein
VAGRGTIGRRSHHGRPKTYLLPLGALRPVRVVRAVSNVRFLASHPTGSWSRFKCFETYLMSRTRSMAGQRKIMYLRVESRSSRRPSRCRGPSYPWRRNIASNSSSRKAPWVIEDVEAGVQPGEE